MNLSYLSICSGLGGAPLALNPEGFHEVACAEIEPFCAALLDHRFGSGRPWRMPDPDAEGLTDDARRERRAAIRAVAHLEPTAMGGNAPPNLGDFTQIRPKELPPVDMLIGGTPCQAFSFAGLRRGMADARGNLTLAFVELAHGLAETNGTRCALWENVPGVLSDDDNAFGCFLGALVGADDALLPCPRPAAGKSNDLWRWRPAGRYPVLDDDGEPTGEVVEREAKHIPRWPRAGMVAGPRARAAWIVRNAQYFGVPQRRERVFVVVDLGGGPDPAAVLFERKSVRGHSGARGKARKDVAGPVKASSARRGGREDNGDGYSLIPEAVYLGNAEDAPFLTASNLGKTVNNQTPLVGEAVMFKPSHYTRGKDGAPSEICPPLTADADKDDQDPLVLAPIAFDARQSDVCVYGDQAAPLDTDGWTQAIAFDTTQITHPANRSVPKPGGPSPTLAKAGHAPAIAFPERMSGTQVAATHDLAPALGSRNPTAIAFSCKDHGQDASADVAPTLRSMAEVRGNANGGGQLAVAFDVRGREGGAQIEGPHDTANLRAASGGSSRSYVAVEQQLWAVRRLTPGECERLQGVPVGHTDIPWRGKDHAPDGPRYRAIGNGWATPVVAWLGGRIRENWPTPAPAQ